MQKLDSLIIETQPNPNTAVIWLHGLGADGHDFEPIVPELNLNDLKIRFIFPHAPVRPITLNGNRPMRAWFNIESLDRLQSIDFEGLLQSHQAVEKLIQEQKEKGIPANRIILAGFSQGGTIALLTALLHQETLGGVLFLSSFLPVKNMLSRLPGIHPHSFPIFMAHGIYDDIIPLKLAEITRDELTALNYKIEWQQYPIPHSVSPQEIQDIAAWFRKII